MIISVAKEVRKGERRVALVPETVAKLVELGFEVLIESGAGEGSLSSDDAYKEAGAEVIGDVASLFDKADIILKVRPPYEREEGNESDLIRSGSLFIGFLNPLENPEITAGLADRRVTAFAMEFVPRISRAQTMDALSSQASVAGYKAALMSAEKLGKFFPMLTTAAGTIPPARVLVIGAGVAGLQAIATARRLGAVVEAFDIRPTAKEEVQSLGARFLEVELEEETIDEGGYAREVSEASREKELQMLFDHVQNSDVVITTAAVPGKKAPLLLTEEMVGSMRPGSVVVDVAAEQGGNCVLTRIGETVDHNGVKVIGPLNLPSSLPVHASEMYSKNISTLLLTMCKGGEIVLDFEDEIIDAACVTHNGIVRNERVKRVIGDQAGSGV
jgi:NAD(P) transhydrogenase subunit alpha